MTHILKTVKALRLHNQDSVAVALQDIAAGEYLEQLDIETLEPIKAGHKVCLCELKPKQTVLKYQQHIGIASQTIKPGEWVHSHNLSMPDSNLPAASREFVKRELTNHSPDTFMGFRRHNGKAATRNYIAVAATVSCANNVVQRICQRLNQTIQQSYPNIDGVVAVTHSGGCAINSSGLGLELLQRSLAGWLQHPNFAGVLLVSLGCETNQIDSLLDSPHISNDKDQKLRVDTVVIQDSGGSHSAIEQGIEKILPRLQQWNEVVREPIPASELSLALQCGGSDGFSGISANPALGLACDRLIDSGGCAILSETPEIYGAEHLLMERCQSTELSDKLQQKVHWWQQYVEQQGESLDHNPSHGNKIGGITTILEKSLGAIAKSGNRSISGIYDYAEPINEKGLAFMDSPGYDPVSITGQVASGANIICFTTGRGSNYGCQPVPSIKLASNSFLYQRMPDDMDLNCGHVIDGTHSLEAMAEKIYQEILAVASGKKTASELLQMGDNAFVPWSLGAIL